MAGQVRRAQKPSARGRPVGLDRRLWASRFGGEATTSVVKANAARPDTMLS